MSFYQRYSGSELLKQVGDDDGSVRRSTGEQGHLSFGPHISLEPGNYIAAFYIRRSGPISGGSIDIDVYEATAGQLSHIRLNDSELFTNIAGQIALNFTITSPIDMLEVRLFVEAGVIIEVHQLVVFSVDFQRWAA